MLTTPADEVRVRPKWHWEHNDSVLQYEGLRYAHAAILSVTSLLSVLGNVLNFLALRKLPTISESRKVFYSFLSAADLVTGILMLPSVVAALTGKWPFGFGFCVVYAYMIITNLGISIGLIFVITLDCYIAISRPLHYPSIVNKSRAIAVCSFIVVAYYTGELIILAIGTDAPFSEVKYFRGVGVCIVDYESRGVGTYSVLVFCVSIFPSAFMLLSLQCRIAYVARKQARRVAQQIPTSTTDYGTETEVGGSSRKRSKLNRHGRLSELKGIYVCIVVSVSFFAGWLPTSAWQIFAILNGRPVENVLPLIPLLWLSYSQCWTNPLIYMVMKRSYRDRMRMIFLSVLERCQRCRKNNKLRMIPLETI